MVRNLVKTAAIFFITIAASGQMEAMKRFKYSQLFKFMKKNGGVEKLIEKTHRHLENSNLRLFGDNIPYVTKTTICKELKLQQEFKKEMIEQFNNDEEFKNMSESELSKLAIEIIQKPKFVKRSSQIIPITLSIIKEISKEEEDFEE